VRCAGDAPERRPPVPDKAPPADSGQVRRVESTTLFQLGREVVIVHHGQEYRLRITKSDKLILTK
jgi:hemin uptake protein HemP